MQELVFGGCVEKSPVSRNPEVPFESSAYSISALARGKELRLTLSPLPGAQPHREPLALVFRFGMTGSFQLVPSDALPPHAHLRFYTAPPGPRLALCFVDIRRFGRWDLGGESILKIISGELVAMLAKNIINKRGRNNMSDARTTLLKYVPVRLIAIFPAASTRSTAASRLSITGSAEFQTMTY